MKVGVIDQTLGQRADSGVAALPLQYLIADITGIKIWKYQYVRLLTVLVALTVIFLFIDRLVSRRIPLQLTVGDCLGMKLFELGDSRLDLFDRRATGTADSRV